MARYSVSWSGLLLAAASTSKTMVQLVTPSTAQVRIIELSVSTTDTTTTDSPVEVILQRQTTAGTASAGTVSIDNVTTLAAGTTGQTNFTVEPVAGAVLRRWKIPINGGLVYCVWPYAREPEMDVSTRLGVTVTSGTTITAANTACSGTIVFEGMGG
jgi:hypothetical protein